MKEDIEPLSKRGETQEEIEKSTFFNRSWLVVPSWLSCWNREVKRQGDLAPKLTAAASSSFVREKSLPGPYVQRVTCQGGRILPCRSIYRSLYTGQYIRYNTNVR